MLRTLISSVRHPGEMHRRETKTVAFVLGRGSHMGTFALRMRFFGPAAWASALVPRRGNDGAVLRVGGRCCGACVTSGLLSDVAVSH